MPNPKTPAWTRALVALFMVVDSGFILYWTITALGVLPREWLYKDYTDPLLVAWNWSFLPLDLAISATGYSALWLRRRASPRWRAWAVASLAFTSASGFQAISFWVLRSDFDPWWWAPNLFLLVYPWFFLPRLADSDPA